MLGLLSGAFPCLKGDFLCCWGVYFVNFVYFCSGIYIIMYMKKYVFDLRVTSVECLGDRFLLLVTTNPDGPLPEMVPGQFAQLRIDDSKDTFLRRPISLHSFDRDKNEVSFLVQKVKGYCFALGEASGFYAECDIAFGQWLYDARIAQSADFACRRWRGHCSTPFYGSRDAEDGCSSCFLARSSQ